MKVGPKLGSGSIKPEPEMGVCLDSPPKNLNPASAFTSVAAPPTSATPSTRTALSLWGRGTIKGCGCGNDRGGCSYRPNG